MDHMFDSTLSLSQVILGDHFSFSGANAATGALKTTLMDPAESDTYTGKWQALGDGDLVHPGSRIRNS